MYNPFNLNRKKILITGASSGIGRATAIECSKMGADLLISGRNKERLEQTFNSLEETGNHIMLVADLNKKDDIDNLFNQLPALDGLVHCAGITMTIPFFYANESNISEIMHINFFVPVLLTKTLLKSRKLKNYGSIVFISSVEGVYCSTPGNSLYSASKGAINGMIKGIALDVAGRGIRVNSINPGLIETSILSEGVITDEQLKENMKKYPLKRYGKPEEIAYAVIYLLSDASLWLTGSNIVIDGGLIIN